MSPTNALIKTVVIGFNSRTERLDNIPYVSDLGELGLQVINSGQNRTGTCDLNICTSDYVTCVVAGILDRQLYLFLQL